MNKCAKETKNDRNLISVIIPVYNAEKYLRRCLNSILAQTYKDYEILVVNDGSSDGSGKTCDEYEREYENVEVIHLRKNEGQAKARNIGIKHANGKWLCFVDADDCIAPNYLEILLRLVNDNDVKIGICDAIESDTYEADKFQDISETKIIKIDDDTLSTMVLSKDIHYWIACGKIIDAGIVKKHMFKEGHIYEDNEAVFRWFLDAKYVGLINSRLYFYYQNPEGTTRRGFDIKQLDRIWALEQQLVEYKSISFGKTYWAIYRRYLLALASCSILATNNKAVQIKLKLKLFQRYIMNGHKASLIASERNYVYEALFPRVMAVYYKMQCSKV